MLFNPNYFLNCFLWKFPCKIPIGNCHYMTGCDLVNLKNLACIESTLTNLTCNCKQMCNGMKQNFKR